MQQLTSRAAGLKPKLELARASCVAIDGEIAQAALEASEGIKGADKRLADLRLKSAAAERDAADFERAHALAVRLDAKAQAEAKTAARAAQLAEFTGHARARDQVVVEICGALASINDLYGRYFDLTASMARTVPAGATLPVMAMGANGCLGSAYGNLEQMIAAEAFRLSGTSKTARLPFAKAPGMALLHNAPAIAPAAETFRATTAAIISRIEEHVAAVDAADSRKAEEAA
ncbi:hypothetical protein [Bradyrhizobium sp. SZCCHNS3053]|uniref:hypothetical protein n=1 Tax=Bradyrhizobium sp. SZCCHNS3053 TaxID=3057322 RepID=UPI0029170824|nr:hypothetical protein [Bradyrhizobium sp. SZCCHNS3053]